MTERNFYIAGAESRRGTALHEAKLKFFIYLRAVESG